MYYINSKISYNEKIIPVRYYNFKNPLFSKEEALAMLDFSVPLLSSPKESKN